MTDKRYYSPQEAVSFLNEKLQPEKPLTINRLARLRREKRVKGERVGAAKTSLYTHKALEMVTLADLQDKRKVRA